MLSSYTSTLIHASAPVPKTLTVCVPEENFITEQAVVKWILVSLCQPSKLAIRYPAVAS